MNNIERAIMVAFTAHQGQVDKAGKPYILHPLTVAMKQQSEEGFIVGMLHDVVEDSDITIDFLKEQGFSDAVIEAVQLLTHDKNEDYFDYIRRVKKNSLAKGVKLADLMHNSDLTRLPEITDKDRKRAKKYQDAILMLY